MRVIVFAEDLSGRGDDGHYTVPSAEAAFEIFFGSEDEQNFADQDGENPVSREEIEEIFSQDRRVTFFNSNGEKVVISLDPAP